MVGRAIPLIVALTMLAGCARPEPQIIVRREVVRVKVPVAVIPEIPAGLAVPSALKAPVFVPPQDPQASSALTAEGERALKLLLLELKTRDAQWRAWARPSDAGGSNNNRDM